eukprot:TRINITY_DN45919_c0_g1_i1.p1 TRINITY_DN45919_c0_g1~~TRINITY_DN45919_c0_g1_i1.p1  ORF type:complete len:151 (-),score=14.91 TRINITY_DN45919_c0_g1_i1:293-745(-)
MSAELAQEADAAIQQLEALLQEASQEAIRSRRSRERAAQDEYRRVLVDVKEGCQATAKVKWSGRLARPKAAPAPRPARQPSNKKPWRLGGGSRPEEPRASGADGMRKLLDKTGGTCMLPRMKRTVRTEIALKTNRSVTSYQGGLPYRTRQ